MTSSATLPFTPAALTDATTTARDLAHASLSENTRRMYASALRGLDTALAGAPLNDDALALYLGRLYDAGRAASSAAMVVAAARFRARITGAPNPVGPVSERVLAGYRRRARKRGRGQARPLTADGLAAILATAHLPRETGRGRESDEVARRRGTMDCAIAGLLFHAGMRRSELAALEWRDIEEAPSLPDAILVTVRASKTNQAGERADVRMVKNGAADALRKLRDSAGEAPEARVIPLSPSHIGHRLQAAARAAGLGKLTAHSGRVGLASELTARGASTADVMLAGGWQSAAMVARYSSGASAEIGAVARYL